MNEPMKDGGPAFPTWSDGATLPEGPLYGMTLRDWFAGQALAAMQLSHDYSSGVCNSSAVARAFLLADTMLAARNPQTPAPQ